MLITIGKRLVHTEDDLPCTKINPEVGEILIDYITKNSFDPHQYPIYGHGDMGLTLEGIFRNLHPDAPDKVRETTGRPTNSVMTQECKEWAGLDRFDPYVPILHTTVDRKETHELGDPDIPPTTVRRAHTWGSLAFGGINHQDWCSLIRLMME